MQNNKDSNNNMSDKQCTVTELEEGASLSASILVHE